MATSLWVLVLLLVAATVVAEIEKTGSRGLSNGFSRDIGQTSRRIQQNTPVPTQLQALRSVSSGLDDPRGVLASWFSPASNNPCDGTWTGVECSTPDVVTNLVLFGTGLSGTVPDALRYLTGLQTLYLTVNQLSGTLPASWSSLTDLNVLFLRSNELSGTLPPEWSSLQNLRNINLASNNLTGTVPSSWGTITTLAFLGLSSNTVMCGVLPGSLAQVTDSTSTRLDLPCENQPFLPLSPGQTAPPPLPLASILFSPAPPPAPPSTSSESWISKYWWVIVVIVGGVLLLLLLLLLLLALKWRRDARQARTDANKVTAAAADSAATNQELREALLQIQGQLVVMNAKMAEAGIPNPTAVDGATPNPLYTEPTGAQPWAEPVTAAPEEFSRIDTAYQHFYSARGAGSESSNAAAVAAQASLVQRLNAGAPPR